MRLLLVDDEFFVRERIMNQMKWETIGVDDVRAAEGGVEALRIASDFHPDILVTDVRMPQMDGIKLAEEIRRRHAECKIIFISGYSDVPYLRSAIRLQAVNYVEKPIDMSELSASIRNTVNNINEEQLARKSLQSVQEKTKCELKMTIARGLIYEESVAESLELLKTVMDISAKSYFATAIVQIIGWTEQKQLTDRQVSGLIYNVFAESNVQAIGFIRQDKIVIHLFLSFSQDRRKDILKPYFRTINDSLLSYEMDCISMVGRFTQNPTELPLSYQSALQGLPRCFYKKPGYLSLNQEVTNQVFDLESLSLSEFSHALKKDDAQSILYLVNNLTNQLKMKDDTSPHQVIRFYYSILVLMFRLAQKENIQLFKRFSDEYEVLDHINQFMFLDELNDFTIQTIHRFYEKANNNLTDNTVVKRIIRYLEHNYQNPDLSVTMIAEHMKLSSTYICHLFKNTLGITLGNYLTQLRIEKAQELIVTGNYKVKEIAQRVGYRSGNYFSYKFKKRMGHSPSGSADEDDQKHII